MTSSPSARSSVCQSVNFFSFAERSEATSERSEAAIFSTNKMMFSANSPTTNIIFICIFIAIIVVFSMAINGSNKLRNVVSDTFGKLTGKKEKFGDMDMGSLKSGPIPEATATPVYDYVADIGGTGK